jgi:hypothetical protein
MTERQRGCRVIQVIESTVCEGEGDGSDNIYREVKTYYTLDGRVLAVNDPCPGGKGS